MIDWGVIASGVAAVAGLAVAAPVLRWAERVGERARRWTFERTCDALGVPEEDRWEGRR